MHSHDLSAAEGPAAVPVGGGWYGGVLGRCVKPYVGIPSTAGVEGAGGAWNTREAT